MNNRHFRCTTVIPAQAGIQDWGFPAAQPSFPRRRESRTGGSRLHSRHSHTGGNPELGVPRCTAVIPAQAGIQNWGFPAAQPSFPHRRESRTGGSRLHNRHSRTGGNPELGVPGCTTVIPAQAGIQDWGFPAAQPSFPRRRESKELGVPRCTAVIPAQAGIQNWGFPAAQPSFSHRRESRIGGSRLHNRHSRAGGNPRIGGSRLHNRHSRAGGNPRIGGSRLHNRHSSRRRESRIGSYAKVSESGYPGVLRGIRLVVP